MINDMVMILLMVVLGSDDGKNDYEGGSNI